jgi:hypothetical protein
MSNSMLIFHLHIEFTVTEKKMLTEIVYVIDSSDIP